MYASFVDFCTEAGAGRNLRCQSAFDSDPLSASNCDPPPEGGTGGEAPPPGQPAVWPDGCLPFHRCLMKRSCYSQRAGSNSDADSLFYGSSLHAFQQDTKSSEEKPGRVSYVPSAADLGSNTKPDGGKRPLGTAKAVKDTLSVPTLSRSFSGYSYGLQRPWPDQRHFVITRGRSPVR